MKKNTMMRVASALLVAVLLTTCAISGTFAKYVTSATGSDEARVARWGFTSDGTLAFDELFITAYDSGKVSASTDVIAPGTFNSDTFSFEYLNGTEKPEVSYSFTVDTTGSEIAANIKNNKNIVWSLDGVEFAHDDTSTSWDKLIAAIKLLSGEADGSADYTPGNLPTGFGFNNEHTIKWEWKFGDGSATLVYDTDTDGVADMTQDQYDTMMGNKAALDEVKIVITITATQLD
jgi:hypothetical protein